MRAFSKVLILTSLLCGCVSVEPNRVTGPSSALSLASFEGCYENRGQPDEGTRSHFLTRTIWPGLDLAHETIDAVQVEVTGSDTVRATAYARHQVVRQDSFVEGKDFAFRSGQIIVSSEFGSAAAESGNPFIGIGVATAALGLEADGTGRSVETTKFAGTAFLVVPVAGSVSSTARFRPAPDLCLVKSPE